MPYTAPTDVSGLPDCTYKASDETVNNSDTLQDDDDLKFTASASAKYFITLLLKITTTAVADLKLKFDCPGSYTYDLVNTGAIGELTSSAQPQIALADMWTEAADETFNGASSAQTAIWWGIIEADGTGGEVNLQWAQNTAEATDTKIHQGSCLIVQKVS